MRVGDERYVVVSDYSVYMLVDLMAEGGPEVVDSYDWKLTARAVADARNCAEWDGIEEHLGGKHDG